MGEAGKVILEGSKNNKQTSKNANKKGSVKLKVKARGKAARKLKKNGGYKLKAKLVFKPDSDCSNKNRSKKVKLVRKG